MPEFIQPLPKNYWEHTSFAFDNVFLWRNENIYVMDNHKSALWCWMQQCDPEEKYNFLHVDKHYDLMDHFYDEDVKQATAPGISFKCYSEMKRANGDDIKVLIWDNYIRMGYMIHPNWFRTNLFFTQHNGDKTGGWGHPDLPICEEELIFLPCYLSYLVKEGKKDYADYRFPEDFKNKWIVNLDLDVFFSSLNDDYYQLFSDDFIRMTGRCIHAALPNIHVVTIAMSPDCLMGENMKIKWANGWRVLGLLAEGIPAIQPLLTEIYK